MPTIQASITQAIVEVIQGVPDTGRVYDRIKYRSNWQGFQDTFLFTDPVSGMRQVRGWWVTLPTLNERITNGTTFDMHWHNYTYPIHTVMSYSDEGKTEPAFGDMLWAVFEALHNQSTLGLGPANSINGASVIDASIDVQVPIVDMRMFGSILCHHAELRLTVGVGDPVNWVP